MVEFRIGIRIYRNFVNSYISTPTGIPIMTLYRRKLPNPTRNRYSLIIYYDVTRFGSSLNGTKSLNNLEIKFLVDSLRSLKFHICN